MRAALVVAVSKKRLTYCAKEPLGRFAVSYDCGVAGHCHELG